MISMVQLCCTHSPEVPKTSGVYSIRSKNRKEVYIGSTVNLHKRFRTHLFKLMKGNHPNRKLQQCFNKRQILFFRVLEYCPPMILRRMEQAFLDEHKNNHRLLNGARTAAHHSGR